jgi:hypothetical protein
MALGREAVRCALIAALLVLAWYDAFPLVAIAGTIAVLLAGFVELHLS